MTFNFFYFNQKNSFHKYDLPEENVDEISENGF